MPYVLRTLDLSKKYKQATVVDKINIHLTKGEIYGFIGQNGAGKTTTIRMILNLIKSSGGSVELFGEQVNDKNIYKHFHKIGAIIETPGFYLNLTGRENLDIHRIMMDVSEKQSIDFALKTVGLKDEENKKVSHYSLGMKQRLGLARALLHNPELLILDEPTNGLDPQGIIEVRDMLIKIAEQGTTIFVSSHILSEVERMISKVGILHKGRLIEEISKKDFDKKCTKSSLFRVDEPAKALTIIKENLNTQDISISDGCVLMSFDNEAENSRITRLLIEHGIEVKESKIMSSTLEDYFVELTGVN